MALFLFTKIIYYCIKTSLSYKNSPKKTLQNELREQQSAFHGDSQGSTLQLVSVLWTQQACPLILQIHSTFHWITKLRQVSLHQLTSSEAKQFFSFSLQLPSLITKTKYERFYKYLVNTQLSSLRFLFNHFNFSFKSV